MSNIRQKMKKTIFANPVTNIVFYSAWLYNYQLLYGIIQNSDNIVY